MEVTKETEVLIIQKSFITISDLKSILWKLKNFIWINILGTFKKNEINIILISSFLSRKFNWIFGNIFDYGIAIQIVKLNIIENKTVDKMEQVIIVFYK